MLRSRPLNESETGYAGNQRLAVGSICFARATDSGGVGHGYLRTTGRLPRLIFRALRLRLLEPGNLEGDIVGLYTDTAGVNHAFLLSHGVFTSFDLPGAHLP